MSSPVTPNYYDNEVAGIRSSHPCQEEKIAGVLKIPGVLRRYPGVLRRYLGVLRRYPGVLRRYPGVLRRYQGVLIHAVVRITTNENICLWGESCRNMF